MENKNLDLVKVYVGTYRKYNHGNLDGEWVSLFDFDCIGDYHYYLEELHNDEEDPEFMIQDIDAPEAFHKFINEYGIDENIFLLKNYSAEDCEIISAYCDVMGKELNEETIEEAFERYIGCFESYYDLGYYYAKDLGAMDMSEQVERYFNFEEYGRDISYDLMESGGYYFLGL